jgi:hypothetical protein
MKKVKPDILLTLLLCITTGIVVYAVVKMNGPNTIIIDRRQETPAVQNVYNSESRYDRAPEPTQGLPFNIPTQGLPSAFRSIGIINVGDQILPLYGRRTLGSSDRWNYYTRTDTYNPVPLPIQFQKRDCMDDVGCQEIMSGENIKINALKKEGKTDIYNLSSLYNSSIY